MRKLSITAFDDFVVGTTDVYTRAEFNTQLALYGKIAFQAVVDQVTGTGTLTLAVRIEHSGDNRNFQNKSSGSSGELLIDPLSTTNTTVGFGYDTEATIVPLLSFARLKLTLGGTTPEAHVKIHVTARGKS